MMKSNPMIIRKANQGISAQRDKYLNTISTMMMEYILVFSICKDMIVRRQEIMSYLQQHLDHLELTTIELQDRKFTMSIKSRERLEYQIQKLIRSKGLQIGFISGERIG